MARCSRAHWSGMHFWINTNESLKHLLTQHYIFMTKTNTINWMWKQISEYGKWCGLKGENSAKCRLFAKNAGKNTRIRGIWLRNSTMADAREMASCETQTEKISGLPDERRKSSECKDSSFKTHYTQNSLRATNIWRIERGRENIVAALEDKPFGLDIIWIPA